MKLIEITERDPVLLKRLLDLWEGSVRATHLFLSDKEILHIKEYVPLALKEIPCLIVAFNAQEEPVAFMGVADRKLEMLFVSPSERGKGIGKKLISYGIEKYHINTLTVNEQNPLAHGFYEHMGFRVYQRTDTDEQGNPYPLLYMKLEIF